MASHGLSHYGGQHSRWPNSHPMGTPTWARVFCSDHVAHAKCSSRCQSGRGTGYDQCYHARVLLSSTRSPAYPHTCSSAAPTAQMPARSLSHLLCCGLRHPPTREPPPPGHLDANGRGRCGGERRSRTSGDATDTASLRLLAGNKQRRCHRWRSRQHEALFLSSLDSRRPPSPPPPWSAGLWVPSLAPLWSGCRPVRSTPM